MTNEVTIDELGNPRVDDGSCDELVNIHQAEKLPPSRAEDWPE